MSNKSITNSLAAWKDSTLGKLKAKRPLRKEKFQTGSGIEIDDLNAPNPDFSYLDSLGFPGQFPYTRGIHASMYRGRLWTMRQYAGFSTAKETNERYKLLLENGANALSVAFDLPTQMGRDSDHARSKGEVGRVGVAIDTVEDMKLLFESIPLDQVSTSMTINATAHILLAMYLVTARESDVEYDKLRGTVQNDILKEYMARGTYIYPTEPSMKLAVDIMEFCKEEVPSWNTISVSGYHIREAGSTAAQELAFTLLNGLAYLEAAVEKGLKVEDVAPRVSFFFNCHNNFLEEVAKFRAARRLWAKTLKEKFKVNDEASLKLRFHTQTAGSSLTAQQPLVNISRTTVQALAAVLGGTQSLHTNGYDEALGLPSKDSARIALRTQQYIAEETGVADVVDPLAGSYFVEELTEQLEEKAVEYFAKIEKFGGMLKAIEQGYPQAEIDDAAYAYQRAVECGEQKVVGVNCYQIEQSLKIEAEKLDAKTEKEQVARLTAIKSKRDQAKVKESLETLSSQAKAGYNVMPSVITSIKHRATLGEISDALRDVWGEYGS